MHTGNIFWDFLPFEGDIVVCPKPDGKISLHKWINILGQQSQKISSSVKVKLSTIQVILKVSMTMLIWNSRDSLQWIAIMSHSLIYSFFLSNKAAFMNLMKDWTGLYCKERSHFISNLYLYSHFISLKIILRLKPFKYSLLQDQNVKEDILRWLTYPRKLELEAFLQVQAYSHSLSILLTRFFGCLFPNCRAQSFITEDKYTKHCKRQNRPSRLFLKETCLMLLSFVLDVLKRQASIKSQNRQGQL